MCHQNTPGLRKAHARYTRSQATLVFQLLGEKYIFCLKVIVKLIIFYREINGFSICYRVSDLPKREAPPPASSQLQPNQLYVASGQDGMCLTSLFPQI